MFKMSLFSIACTTCVITTIFREHHEHKHGTNQQTVICQGADMFHSVLQVVLSS